MQQRLPLVPSAAEGLVPSMVEGHVASLAEGLAPSAVDGFVAGEAPTFYFVRHARARRYLVRVEAGGLVRVTIPRRGSKREAEAFVARQRAWIARQMRRIAERPARMPAEERERLRAKAVNELPLELRALAARHGLEVSRITIRNQRSRWGSCGRNGHITLNWRLMAMPDWVREYVLVHELMHLRRMDHSAEYWAMVADAYPDYAQARRWLRLNGHTLA